MHDKLALPLMGLEGFPVSLPGLPCVSRPFPKLSVLSIGLDTQPLIPPLVSLVSWGVGGGERQGH